MNQPFIAKCGIVIPVFNEKKSIVNTVQRIQKVLQQVPEWEFQITCVDDGSSDGTSEILKSLPGIELITHQINRGYGASLKTGIRQTDCPWILICDADSTYPIEEIPMLLKEISKGYDMVVGARKGIGIDLSPFRKLARWILRKMTHILTGTMVPDLNSGFRIFRKEIYNNNEALLPMGFSFTTTITMASLYSGYKISYPPIEYDKRVGKSNIKPVRDFFGFTLLIIRISSCFEPLRFFLPLAFFVILAGLAKGSRDFFLFGHIGSLAVILFVLGVQIAMSGIVAEVVVRRSAMGLRRS